MRHVLAATLSLLWLAGMFSRCGESEEEDSAPAATHDDSRHDLSASDSKV